jgi:hypothetical protein
VTRAHHYTWATSRPYAACFRHILILYSDLRQSLSADSTFAEAWVSPCAICGGQGGTGTGFSPCFSVLPCRYHSAVALDAHISPGGWTIGPLVAAVQRRSLTTSIWTTTTTTTSGVFLSRFSDWIFLCCSLLPHLHGMTHPARGSWLYYANDIWWGHITEPVTVRSTAVLLISLCCVRHIILKLLAYHSDALQSVAAHMWVCVCVCGQTGLCGCRLCVLARVK